MNRLMNFDRFPGTSLIAERREGRIQAAIDTNDDLMDLDSIKRQVEGLKTMLTKWNGWNPTDQFEDVGFLDDIIAAADRKAARIEERIRDE